MEFGAESIDQIIYDYLTINVPNPAEVYPDINAVWRSFQVIKSLGTSIISPYKFDHASIFYENIAVDGLFYPYIKPIFT